MRTTAKLFVPSNQSSAVLYHPRSGQICHASGKDPLHSDDDVTQYMQHRLLRSMASSSSSATVYLCLSILRLSNLLPFEPTTCGQSTFWLILLRLGSSSTDLAALAQPVALINVEKVAKGTDNKDPKGDKVPLRENCI